MRATCLNVCLATHMCAFESFDIFWGLKNKQAKKKTGFKIYIFSIVSTNYHIDKTSVE